MSTFPEAAHAVQCAAFPARVDIPHSTSLRGCFKPHAPEHLLHASLTALTSTSAHFMRVYLGCRSVETARGYSRPAILTYSVSALRRTLSEVGA